MDHSVTPDETREAAILGIVARETGIDRALLVPQATIEQLGIASIDLTLAVFELEKHFDIEIPVVAPLQAGESGEFTTVGDLIHHVNAVLDRKGAA